MTVKPDAPMTLTVGDVAARSRVAPSAVRFYANHGVISAGRTTGNQRRFEASAVCRIEVARVAQRVGLTVREIAALFDGLSADPTPEEWGQVAHRLVSEAEERLADLRTHLAALGSGTRLCDIGRGHAIR
ncbi:MerR family transcriptional regulator [Micromonospora sp. NPDC049900]|uniref:MerR family transcriptional regulator n=1 Tax=Micromonospora sp. NPDC049900 TaxID=3364275 RepID=UPI0037A6EDF2